MDRMQFERLTRRLSASDNRRRALLALAAGGLGLAVLTRDDADSKRKKKRKRQKVRCNGLHQACTPDCQESCCAGLMCVLIPGNASLECCVPNGVACDADEDCCVGVCTLIDGVKQCYLAPPMP